MLTAKQSTKRKIYNSLINVNLMPTRAVLLSPCYGIVLMCHNSPLPAKLFRIHNKLTPKQPMNLLKEIRAQFSAREWMQAIFCHIPTANAPRINGGAKLTQPRRCNNFNDLHQHLIQWRKEVANG